MLPKTAVKLARIETKIEHLAQMATDFAATVEHFKMVVDSLKGVLSELQEELEDQEAQK
jgi:predicted  nucleic acid-binding Zn-ribbon protein